MNQVLQDYASLMVQCANYSLAFALSPSEGDIQRLQAAVKTLQHLVSNPSGDALYELRVHTACRDVFLNLMD